MGLIGCLSYVKRKRNKIQIVNAHILMYDLRLSRLRKDYFDYYEKTLVEEKEEELKNNKILLIEKSEETNDIIVSNSQILQQNFLKSDCEFHDLKSQYFYNLTLTAQIYGEEFIEEIVYHVVQLYLRNFVDGIEKYQQKIKDSEYFVDVCELKKHFNFKETSEEALRILREYCFAAERAKIREYLHQTTSDLKDRFPCIEDNNYLYRYDVLSDSGFKSDPCDSFYFVYHTEEDKKELIRAIVLRSFIDRIRF